MPRHADGPKHGTRIIDVHPVERSPNEINKDLRRREAERAEAAALTKRMQRGISRGLTDEEIRKRHKALNDAQ
jgi:hypothetical protein